jgi:uncharacterized membrane protein
MLPNPLHPAIVHLPIALAFLLPLFAVAALVAIRTAWLPRRAWSAVVLLAGLLIIGSWIALETGEGEEDRIHDVVEHELIEAHEESAEAFAALGLILFLVAGTGLSAGRMGGLARGGTVVVALVLLVAGTRVGHLGGELVYVHGAAGVHLDPGAMTSGGSVPSHP